MNFLFYNIIIFTFIKIIFSEDVNEGHVNSFFFSTNNGALFDYSKLNDLIIFGDSYSTTDTNIDNMTYTAKNKSGGKNWPLHLLDYHDMYLWNFAFGGAPMTNTYVKQSHPYALPTQFKYFKSKMTKGKEFSNWEGETTLVAFWFGINDIIKSTRTIEETVEEGLKSMFSIVEEIYNYGAKNFLFFNVPPFDKSPQVINGSYKDVPQFIDGFNTNIKDGVKNFKVNHPLANCILYNSYDEFNYILINHENYNITDITLESDNYPKRNREDFYWSNDNHPTDKVHKIFTDDLHFYLNTISVNKEEALNTTSIKAKSRLVSSSLKKFNITKNYFYIFLINFIIYFNFIL